MRSWIWIRMQMIIRSYKVFELKPDLYGCGPGILTGLPTLMTRTFKSSSLRKRTSWTWKGIVWRLRNSENSQKVSETQLTEGKDRKKKVPSKILTRWQRLEANSAALLANHVVRGSGKHVHTARVLARNAEELVSKQTVGPAILVSLEGPLVILPPPFQAWVLAWISAPALVVGWKRVLTWDRFFQSCPSYFEVPWHLFLLVQKHRTVWRRAWRSTLDHWAS